MAAKTIPYVLRRLQATEGDRQADLARRFGITQSAMSRWLSGERRPQKREHRRMLLSLGVDPRHL